MYSVPFVILRPLISQVPIWIVPKTYNNPTGKKCHFLRRQCLLCHVIVIKAADFMWQLCKFPFSALFAMDTVESFENMKNGSKLASHLACFFLVFLRPTLCHTLAEMSLIRQKIYFQFSSLFDSFWCILTQILGFFWTSGQIGEWQTSVRFLVAQISIRASTFLYQDDLHVLEVTQF